MEKLKTLLKEEAGIGIRLRSLLDGELGLNAINKTYDFNNYDQRNKFIDKIEDRISQNDWLELSTGVTFDKTFTPSRKE